MEITVDDTGGLENEGGQEEVEITVDDTGGLEDEDEGGPEEVEMTVDDTGGLEDGRRTRRSGGQCRRHWRTVESNTSDFDH